MERMNVELLPELVKKQLRQLLDQEELKRSPILAKFLEHVVSTKLSGREDEIKEYTIGVKALGRPVDFNPQLDAIVRIHASRLRNILFKYYHGAGKDDLIVITIPKGTYVPVFDVNNENTDKLQHYVRSQTELNAYEKPDSLQRRVSVKPVLAVLPFHDLSPEHTNNDFLTALGEQLSGELSRFDNLSIISYYATRQLDSSMKDLHEIRNKVGIDYILTGSLRLLNGTLKLNIQLMIVDNGNILWSETFLRHQLTTENTSEIQDEIISQIANSVADDHGMAGTLTKLKPWQDEKERTQVYEAIIQYFDYTYNYDSRKFEATLEVVENAFKTDEKNVFVVSILSKLLLDCYASAVEQDPSMLERGMELADMAVGLDPRCQHAQKALAWGLTLSGNKEKGAEAIDRCISINPVASSNLSTMGLSLIMMGEYENGYAMLKQGIRLNQNPSACAKLGYSLYYYHNQDLEESSRWLERLAPFDIPFFSLLRLAIHGKLNGKSLHPDEATASLRGHENNIIERIVQDPALRSEILKGLEMSGFRTSNLKLAS